MVSYKGGNYNMLILESTMSDFLSTIRNLVLLWTFSTMRALETSQLIYNYNIIRASTFDSGYYENYYEDKCTQGKTWIKKIYQTVQLI